MPYAKTSLRAEQRALREKMRALGLSHRQIAVEFARRYGLRPRAAWRQAYGWSLKEAAEQINSRAGDTGLDPYGSAAMTGPHLCEYENWPGPGPKPAGRRPTPLVLALLATTYNTPTVHDLLDFADYEHMPPADRLILDTSVRAEEQAGQRAYGPEPSPASRASAAYADELPHARQRLAPSPPPAVPVPRGWQPDGLGAVVPPVLTPLATALLSAPRAQAESQRGRLADEAIRIWKLRQAAHYRELTADLPHALTRARSNERDPEAGQQLTGLAALTHLYNAASSLAKSLGSFELAGIAADRAVQTAGPHRRPAPGGCGRLQDGKRPAFGWPSRLRARRCRQRCRSAPPGYDRHRLPHLHVGCPARHSRPGRRAGSCRRGGMGTAGRVEGRSGPPAHRNRQTYSRYSGQRAG